MQGRGVVREKERRVKRYMKKTSQASKKKKKGEEGAQPRGLVYNYHSL
jgi:hypothetical protein